MKGRAKDEVWYPAVIAYLKLWEMQENGLVVPRKGDWCWFDHLDNIDEAVLENCWYYSALSAALDMAQLLHEENDIPFFRQRMDSIRRQFDREFLHEDGYRSGDMPDDRANALVLLTGLCHPDARETVLHVLETVENATPYMEYYVLKAMFEADGAEAAMQRMRRRYQPLVANENSTLWEDFSILGTKNHAWSGGPLTLLYEYAAGIRPESPGFEKVLIAPRETGLRYIQASVLTKHGLVEVEIDRREERLVIHLRLPGNMQGTVRLPAGWAETGDIPVPGGLTVLEYASENPRSIKATG